jgi:prepilin-type N-terminal cleavage/methylation domain-containing protein
VVRYAFTLVEILVVIVILGMLAAMTLPSLSRSLEISKAQINEATMKEIKRASLAFKHDVGFMPDNVSLLIFPYETCAVGAEYNDSLSATCKVMIAFVDSRLSIDKNTHREAGNGDYGEGMARDQVLIDEIVRRLDIQQNGWRGSYIGGNTHLSVEHNKSFDDAIVITKNPMYFLSERDLEIYYNGFDSNETLNDVGMDAQDVSELYPLFCDFNGSRGGYSQTIELDVLYDMAKYRRNLIGELSILDPWGTPYEIQFPASEVIPVGQSRERYARLVSFGENRRRDVNVTMLHVSDYHDDSVLYLYEHNLSNHFYTPKDE